MDAQLPLHDPRQRCPWLRHYLTAIAVISLSFALVVSFGPFYVRDRFRPRQEKQHDHMRSFMGSPRALGRTTGTSYGAGGLHRSRKMLDGQRRDVRSDDTPVSLNEKTKILPGAMLSYDILRAYTYLF